MLQYSLKHAKEAVDWTWEKGSRSFCAIRPRLARALDFGQLPGLGLRAWAKARSSSILRCDSCPTRANHLSNNLVLAKIIKKPKIILQQSTSSSNWQTPKFNRIENVCFFKSIFLISALVTTNLDFCRVLAPWLFAGTTGFWRHWPNRSSLSRRLETARWFLIGLF